MVGLHSGFVVCLGSTFGRFGRCSDFESPGRDELSCRLLSTFVSALYLSDWRSLSARSLSERSALCDEDDLKYYHIMIIIISIDMDSAFKLVMSSFLLKIGIDVITIDK